MGIYSTVPYNTYCIWSLLETGRVEYWYYRTVVQLKRRIRDPTLFVCFEELMHRPNDIEARVRSIYKDYQTSQNATTTTTPTATSIHVVLVTNPGTISTVAVMPPIMTLTPH